MQGPEANSASEKRKNLLLKASALAERLDALFDDLPTEKIMEALDDIGAEARSIHAETTTELLELLENSDSIAILAVMAIRRFFAAETAPSAHWLAGEQHHLELLQAMALRGLPPKAPEAGPLTDVLLEAAGLLEVSARIFYLSLIKGFKPQYDEKAKHRALLLQWIRGTTQGVRGEFNRPQLDRFLRAIFSHLDNDFAEIHGMTASDLLETVQRLLRTIENKVNQYARFELRIRNSHKPEKALKIYCEAFPEENVRRDSIIADASAKGVAPHQMRFYLIEQAATHLLQGFWSFGENEILAACPTGTTAAKRAIEAWSWAFGELKDYPVEHIYLANPVWDRPFVRLAGERFFWPNPASYLSFGFEMFELLMAANATLLKKYQHARALVLEEELGILLKKYFRDGRVIRNIEWKGFETDVVVLIDRTMLIFEAKSGKVAAEAKRGADLRLKKAIEKLMVAPAGQSKGLMELLSKDRREHSFPTKDGRQTINSREIDRFIRVNVVLNSIGTLSSRWPSLVNADWVKIDAVQIPTITIAALETICGILKEQATIAHYLHRRESFEATADYFGDEYDLLAFYLETGFNIGESEFDGSLLKIYGRSNDLSAYHRLEAESHEPPPPTPYHRGQLTLPAAKRTKLFAGIIFTLERRRPEHWLEIADRLLNVPMSTQKKIERSTKLHIMNVRKSPSEMCRYAWTVSGPALRRQAFAFVYYRRAEQHILNEMLRAAAAETMEKEPGIKDCVVVGFDVIRSTDSYSVIKIIK
jgi:hypothetical protein